MRNFMFIKSIMKLLITSYYELKEALLSAANALRKLDIEVVNYPLMQKKQELGDNDCVDDMIRCIKDQKVDVVLWWHISLSSELFEKVVLSSPGVKNIFFNWDEPFNWEPNDLQTKAKHFDCVFVTCQETLDRYLSNGTKKAVCLYPGFDENIHRPLFEDYKDVTDKYCCDVSICCTNLYDGDEYCHQFIQRKRLIDDLYAAQDIHGFTFHIYGPERLRELYPKSYQNFICYEDTNKLFNYSRINICTHVICDKSGYLNERVFLIMASGGLLLVDRVAGLEDVLCENKDCLVLSKEGYVEQIVKILEDYDECDLVRFNAREKALGYTWDKWAKVVYDEFLSEKIDLLTTNENK